MPSVPRHALEASRRDKQIGVVHTMLDRVMTAGWLIDRAKLAAVSHREFVPR